MLEFNELLQQCLCRRGERACVVHDGTEGAVRKRIRELNAIDLSTDQGATCELLWIKADAEIIGNIGFDVDGTEDERS